MPSDSSGISTHKVKTSVVKMTAISAYEREMKIVSSIRSCFGRLKVSKLRDLSRGWKTKVWVVLPRLLARHKHCISRRVNVRHSTKPQSYGIVVLAGETFLQVTVFLTGLRSVRTIQYPSAGSMILCAMLDLTSALTILSQDRGPFLHTSIMIKDCAVGQS